MKGVMNMDLCELGRSIVKLNLVMKLYSRQSMNGTGLYFGQMPILEYIDEHDGCTQIEIAEFIQVTPASIALSTKRLEKSGFITKTTDENNLRCKRLSLTDNARNSMKRNKEIFDAQDAKMFAGFSEEELELFRGFIDRATINLTEEKENLLNHNTFISLKKRLEELHAKKKEGGMDD